MFRPPGKNPIFIAISTISNPHLNTWVKNA